MSKYSLILLCLFIFSCNDDDNNEAPNFSPSLSFDYENLATGESGSFSDVIEYSTWLMTGPMADASQLPNHVHQIFEVSYTFENSPLSFLNLRIGPALDQSLIRDVPSSVFTPTIVFEDLNDYPRLAFQSGDLLSRPTLLRVTFSSQSNTEVGIGAESDFQNQSNAQFIITDQAVFNDRAGNPQLYVAGEFSVDLIGGSSSEFRGEPLYRISNGRFAFTFPLPQ